MTKTPAKRQFQERIRIAEELDIPLQPFLSALMQLGVTADNLPSDSAARSRLDRILQVVDEGVKQGLNTIQVWLSAHPPKSPVRELANAVSEL